MERALVFACAGEQLVGIVSDPTGAALLGVLVIVGGPQYRVGSHRQFVLLSRALARVGIPTMRFDYRGMGDSTGTISSFEASVPDIDAAIAAFRAACPTVRKIVLWGLCDAASAALLYWSFTQNSLVCGMVLLNPWVRSDQSLAATRVKHYYLRRILDPEFLAKLAARRVNVATAVREVGASLLAMLRRKRDAHRGMGFQDRMAAALGAFQGPVLLVLSGEDYTAKEFMEYTASNPLWKGLITRDSVVRAEISKADHTFSTVAWRQEAETLTLDWLKRLFPSTTK